MSSHAEKVGYWSGLVSEQKDNGLSTAACKNARAELPVGMNIADRCLYYRRDCERCMTVGSS